MGMGAIAAYGKAWLVADEDQKDRILELMKETAGMTLTATETAGLRQDIRLAEAEEERTRSFFPTKLEQAETVLESSKVALGTKKRTEEEIQETRGREKDEYGESAATRANLLQMAMDALTKMTIIEKGTQRLPAAEVARDVSEAEAAETAADLAKATHRDRLKSETFIDTRRADVESERQRRAQAIAGKEIAEQFLEQRGPEITTRAGIQQAETTTAKARLEGAITAKLEDMDFADLSARIKFEMEGRLGDIQKAEYETLLAELQTAGLPSDRAPTLLDWAQRVFSPEVFRDIVQKMVKEKIGELIPMEELYKRIQSLEEKKASLRLGERNNIDPNIVLASLVKGDSDFGKELIAMGYSPKKDINYTEVFSGMNGLIDSYKAMLKDPVKGWGIDYDNIARKGRSTKTYTEDDINELIGLIESGTNQGGTLGNLAVGYGTGISPEKRADVIHGITGIMNAKKVPWYMWLAAMEANRYDKEIRPGIKGEEGLESRWGLQNYKAAVAIVAAAQWHFENAIPTTTQPVPGVAQ